MGLLLCKQNKINHIFISTAAANKTSTLLQVYTEHKIAVQDFTNWLHVLTKCQLIFRTLKEVRGHPVKAIF